MLSTDMVMQKFWENNDLNLYYLARFTDKKTKTVLVYGTDSDVYVDATTGERCTTGSIPPMLRTTSPA